MKTLTTGLAVLAIGLAASLAHADDASRTITVSGTGSASAAPDKATMSIGVTEEAKDAREAMRRTSDKVAEVLARLQSSGIDPADIQTRRLSVSPVWSNRRGNYDEPAKITGFVASNRVSVRVLDLPELGAVLDRVLAAGANDFGGLQFGLQDPGPVADAARRAAVADAMAKAALFAEAAGVTLGSVQSLSEHGGQARPVMMEAAAARDAAVPVAAGEVTVSATVTMVFAISD